MAVIGGKATVWTETSCMMYDGADMGTLVNRPKPTLGPKVEGFTSNSCR